MDKVLNMICGMYGMGVLWRAIQSIYIVEKEGSNKGGMDAYTPHIQSYEIHFNLPHTLANGLREIEMKPTHKYEAANY